MSDERWQRFVHSIYRGHAYNPGAKSNALTMTELLGPDDGPWKPWQ